MAKSWYKNSSLQIPNRYHPPGTAPGTLVDYDGQVEDRSFRITLTRYNTHEYQHTEPESLEELWKQESNDDINWIQFEGCQNAVTLLKIGEHYGLHSLSMEDIFQAGERSKLEVYEQYFLAVLYLLDEKSLYASQVSILCLPGRVLTFIEKEGDAFRLLRERMRDEKSTLRKRGTDYLFYAICDSLIDRFLPAVDNLREQLADLEEELFTNTTKDFIQKIHSIKINLIYLEKLITGSRGVLESIHTMPEDLVAASTQFYLRDTLDHAIHAVSAVETYREISGSILDSHLSLVDHEMNQVIKVLTIIATIFIPLSFIAGVYGMNFNTRAGPFSMPELNWPYGYVMVLALMLILAAVMLVVFKRKKWL